jgi:glycosyltransferase involved in cell wall biosynthesis
VYIAADGSHGDPGDRTIGAQSRLISVIIPCYDQGRFVGEAIESTLRQSYPAKEVIVVDDGSRDDTAEVVGRYAEVTLIRQANGGLAAARNRGVEASRGEYLLFLDADDRFTEGALAVAASSLDARPDCAFVSGHYTLIDADGSPMPHAPSPCAEDDHYCALLRGNYIGMHGTVIYRRAVFESVGLFDVSLLACEDYELYLRIARRFPVACHHNLIAEYRQHANNMSRDYTLMMKTSLRVLGSQRDFVSANQTLECARREGIRFWRDYCATGLIKQMKREIAAGNLRRAIPGALTLLRYHPRAFMSVVGVTLSRTLTDRVRPRRS